MFNFNEEWLFNYIYNELPSVECLYIAKLMTGHYMEFFTDPLISECIQHMESKTFFTHELINTEKLLAIAIAGLQIFIQENFIGPITTQLDKNFITIIEKTNGINDFLSVDGEPINENVKFPQLLSISKFLLEKLLFHNPNSLIINCWTIRRLYIHQRILTGPANSIYEEFIKLSDKITITLDKISNEIQLENKVAIILELVQGFLLYKRIGHARVFLDKIKILLKTNINIEGVLGKRTIYQQKPLPQMVLRVISTVDLPLSIETHQNTILPPLLKLNDDLRLEKISLESDEDNERLFSLPSISQLLILAELKYIRLSQPKDKLADEELEPYLTTLLYQNHGPWSCRIGALLENIQFEEHHKRTVDRSLKQCEEVLHLIAKEEHSSVYRFSYVYQSYLRPIWEIKVQFGRLMISLGMIKTALDLYLNIKKWNEVIACYTLLGLNHKAAEIIEQQLEKHPTVELYCLLGNAKNDVSYYERAWEFSGQRSGRAQRDWGIHYFTKRDYKLAIIHLQQSIQINSLQEEVWSRLGYAAMAVENWKLAAKAYKHYTYIEPNGFESWNNLANAYVKLDEKDKAHKVLQEALKCNWNNWKVWENFLLVSIDTGHFEDGINAYNQLIEMKGKYYDREVLQILTNSIMGNVKDAEDRPTQRLHKKLKTLISHLCVLLPNDGALWEIAAQLVTNHESSLSKARKLQKAYKCYTQVQMVWSKSPDSALKVLEISMDLCASSIKAIEQNKQLDASEKQATHSQLSSARLCGQAAARAVATENWENCTEILIELHKLLDKIKELLVENK